MVYGSLGKLSRLVSGLCYPVLQIGWTKKKKERKIDSINIVFTVFSLEL